jgi:hypothetical protein
MEHEATRGRASDTTTGTAGRVALVSAMTALVVLWSGVAWAQAAGETGWGSSGVVVAVDDLPDLVVPAATAKLAPKASGRLLPNLRSGLLPDLRAKVIESFGLAASQVRSVDSCRGLFARLGADGGDRLQRTLYYPATPEVADKHCARGVLAATNPGSSVTWLCPDFKSLTTRRAALVLIHEALHFAGLPERPQAAGAMSSPEINDLVHDACRL